MKPLYNKKFSPAFNKYFIIGLLIAATSVFAQKETAIWYYGSHGGLDFNSGNPAFLTNGQLQGGEGCATVSTSEGNLLFYTDGQQVFNRNHIQMPHGSGLLGTGTPAQAAIIIQKPGNQNIYYIFTVSGQEDQGENGLNYYEVDLTLDGGLGDVTLRNGVILTLPSSPLATPVTEKLTAIAHSDGNKIWVICHSANNNNNFLAYLVSETGVNTTPVISSVGMVNDYAFDHNCVGHLKVSPNGKKIASGSMYVASFLVPVPVLTAGLELFDFDAATGSVSNPQLLNTAKNYGVEFSANSKVLYATNTLTGNANRIAQYDITLPTTQAIVQSELIIPSATDLGTVQLAIDGKIYVARGGIEGAIGVINSPATLGTGCGYQANALYSGTNSPGLGFPNFLPSLFEEKIEAEGLCVNSPTRFTIKPYLDIVSPVWDFGDPGSGTNTSTDVSPFHTYTQPGEYQVNVVFFNTAGTSFEITSTVTIIGAPVANTAPNLTVCGNTAPATFNLLMQTPIILGAQPATDFTVAYYTSQADAEAGNNSITTPAAFTNTVNPQTIYAGVTNASGCSSYTSFQVNVQAAPVVTQAPNLTVCDTDNNGASVFNLTQQNAVLTGAQTGITVTYYTTQADAENDTNAITAPAAYTNTTSPQTIFAALENTAGCISYTSFTLNAPAVPAVVSLPNLSLCDDTTTDGFTSFNLAQQDALLQAGQPGVAVAYYTSQADAEAGTNVIPSPSAFTNTVNPQTIYAAVTNTAGCSSYTSFQVNVIALPVVAQAPDLSLCDSANNGTAEFNLTTQDAVYQQGQPGVTVSYFITEADAEVNANAIAIPAAYTNTQDAQTIYVRIDNGSCYAVGSFTLQVNDAPVLASMLEVTGCSPFNLTEIETGLDSGLDVSYYTAEANAEQATNAIANPAEYTTNDIAAHLYVRAENADGCYTVAELHISPGDCFIQRGISPGGSIGQNDTFDLSNLDVTKLMIYNRYGKEVFSFNGNYTNQWGGQTDNGQELPTGTYFYMFQRNTGEAKTGWIYINRQN